MFNPEWCEYSLEAWGQGWVPKDLSIHSFQWFRRVPDIQWGKVTTVSREVTRFPVKERTMASLQQWSNTPVQRCFPLKACLILTLHRSKVSTCLLVTDPRSQYAVRLPHKLPGMHYSADEQCQILFGTNATFCKNMEVRAHGVYLETRWEVEIKLSSTGEEQDAVLSSELLNGIFSVFSTADTKSVVKLPLTFMSTAHSYAVLLLFPRWSC